MADFHVVGDHEAPLNALDLRKSLPFAAHFEKPLAICHQVTLDEHGKLVCHPKLGGEIGFMRSACVGLNAHQTHGF